MSKVKSDGRAKSAVHHTGRTTTVEKPAELGWTHRVTRGGVDYFVDLNAVSALDDTVLQKESQGVVSVGALFGSAPSLTTVAALIWLSQRQHGQRVGFLEIAGSLTMGEEIDLEENTPGESDPEG